MKTITKYFFQGLLFVIPIFLTVYVLYWLFTKIDNILPIKYPGVGFVTTLLVVTLIGFLASNFLTKRLLVAVDALFARLPLVKLLYSSVKDLINAFVGDKKSFNKPVLLELGHGSGVHALGFITRDALDNLGLDEMVAVYLPQSYNFAGNLLVVRSELVKPLDTNSSELMTFIVSGGVAGAD
ncbi:MAG: DUF502 domain-containing protein [Candidatus Saccharibacteria bacterium]